MPDEIVEDNPNSLKGYMMNAEKELVNETAVAELCDC